MYAGRVLMRYAIAGTDIEAREMMVNKSLVAEGWRRLLSRVGLSPMEL